MSNTDLEPEKVLWIAVQLTSKGDIRLLQTLVSRYRRVLRNDIVFRILLTHLPESLEPLNYVPFLEDLVLGRLVDSSKEAVDLSAIKGINAGKVNKNPRKLHLVPLLWKDAPADVPQDPLVIFLMHRALRIDRNTGLLEQVPSLLAPFLSYSSYLRNWTITTILPLLRLNYEYHPDTQPLLTIREFEALDDSKGTKHLLSRTGKDAGTSDEGIESVGRDLRGLVGPWLYGDNRWKRRKVQTESSGQPQAAAASLEQAGIINHKYTGWELVFAWIIAETSVSWETAVKAIEQWDGPGDVDLGGFGDGTEWLDEEEQRHLEQRYAKAALATAYLVPESTIEALTGVHRIISRIIRLLDLDKMPTLEASAAILTPVPSFENSNHLSSKSATYLRNDHLEEKNTLTNPNEPSINFLRALLVSAYLLTRAGEGCTIKRAGELALLQDEREQMIAFRGFTSAFSHRPGNDDRFWIKVRNELLWLRSWGAEELEDIPDTSHGRGVFGRLSKEFIEVEVFKVLLANAKYALAQSIYETSPEKPLPKELLQSAIFTAAENAYDNATNPNKTRGGVKKCDDILKAFPDTIREHPRAQELRNLIFVTDEIGQYSLVLKQGQPFLPVNLRVHGDPLSILNKVLEQNDKSYTQINDFVRMGREIVEAGLTLQVPNGRSSYSDDPELKEKLNIAEKRVVSMCIDVALSEDDFETAYSYVVTRLKDIGRQAHCRTPELERRNTGLIAQRKPQRIDDWSWRAALQAGKYRRNAQSTRATHLGNTSGNPEIRHLQQRMECLSQALRLAPKDTLQEILNVYRRCEEELETQIRQEAEQEEAWDEKADDSNMPGGYASTPARTLSNTRTPRRNKNEEAPVSFFDLSKESITRAQTGLSALSMFRGKSQRADSVEDSHNMPIQTDGSIPAPDLTRTSSGQASIRKRDQIRNVAVGTLAGGIGWLINAPPVQTISAESSERGNRDSMTSSGSTSESLVGVQKEEEKQDKDEITWDDDDGW
ncbi:hypothetical protein MFRU_048g00250 [Monilinia fructicola]|uniref:Sec39 domain-containing protein n=1 Tax=Monilinia fructicola TaxID=38448 RepID=A0A5M9JIH2_MONFR|nr:hypothetical protein EYC84_008002 [Monilinia fructicola]KAG4025913.1 hypothetical protein MFRU_048g00250 [Monilinia fructicola]